MVCRNTRFANKRAEPKASISVGRFPLIVSTFAVRRAILFLGGMALLADVRQV
jgi:hypothetical protein